MPEHVSLRLLRQIQAGQRDASELAAAALGHLLDICADCRRAVEAWGEMPDLSTRKPEAPIDHGSTESANPVAGERCLHELLELPPDQRSTRIREDPAQFAVPVLAERLLEKIADLLPERLRAAHELATLAGMILRHSSSSPKVASLYAVAVAEQANALRAQGELLQADSLMEAAKFLLHLDSEGKVDPLVSAKMDSLEGSLRKSQRRGDEAIELLQRSAKIYLEHGQLVSRRISSCHLRCPGVVAGVE